MADAASRHAHWDHVYRKKAETAVSWFQENPVPSLALLKNGHLPEGAAIIDRGGVSTEKHVTEPTHNRCCGDRHVS